MIPALHNDNYDGQPCARENKALRGIGDHCCGLSVKHDLRCPRASLGLTTLSIHHLTATLLDNTRRPSPSAPVTRPGPRQRPHEYQPNTNTNKTRPLTSVSTPQNGQNDKWELKKPPKKPSSLLRGRSRALKFNSAYSSSLCSHIHDRGSLSPGQQKVDHSRDLAHLNHPIPEGQV